MIPITGNIPMVVGILHHASGVKTYKSIGARTVRFDELNRACVDFEGYRITLPRVKYFEF